MLLKLQVLIFLARDPPRGVENSSHLNSYDKENSSVLTFEFMVCGSVRTLANWILPCCERVQRRM